MTEQKRQGFYLKPLFYFTVTLVAIFLIELLVMFLLRLLPGLSPFAEAFLDAFLLTLLVVPFLYFFLLKPIHKNIELRERRKAEHDNLLEISRLKSEFISTAAHELNTPLATIMGFTELLFDGGPIGVVSDEQRMVFLNHIYDSSERLSKIVDDLLDVSRIESGQNLSLDKKVQSIRNLLEKIVSRFKLITSYQIYLNISPEVPEQLVFDENRIDQVMQNLLSNAIKYSKRNSTITIVAEGDADNCVITVIDQGIGMTDEQKSRIFEKFYRGDSADTAIKGVGLGMSIVKEIVEDHGGTIWVDSLLGEGSSVCFTLPITKRDNTGEPMSF
jgi:signal transduction histidine kinase